MVYFHSLNDVCSHICRLASELSGKDEPFEITGVCVSLTAAQQSPTVSCKYSDKTFATTDLVCDSLQDLRGSKRARPQEVPKIRIDRVLKHLRLVVVVGQSCEDSDQTSTTKESV